MKRKAVRTDKAMEGDIVRACLDSGERRLLLASSLGEILVYGFLQVFLQVVAWNPGSNLGRHGRSRNNSLRTFIISKAPMGPRGMLRVQRDARSRDDRT